MGWGRYGGFAPYVRVADRKKQAQKKVTQLIKKGQVVRPVILSGRTIAQSFWGKAWCVHLESYSDFDNRLPRGRTYVRNGSVIDLQIHPGEIKALVSGSSLYKINISMAPLAQKKWKTLVKESSGKVDSLIELLLGKFSKGVMQIMTHPEKGLFPHAKEIKLSCSCPDWADMCKHVAAVLYGIGARLDEHPEDLFLLRQVNHNELITQVQSKSLIKTSINQAEILEDSDLSSLFGIELEKGQPAPKIRKRMSKIDGKVLSKKRQVPKIKAKKVNQIKLPRRPLEQSPRLK